MSSRTCEIVTTSLLTIAAMPSITSALCARAFPARASAITEKTAMRIMGRKSFRDLDRTSRKLESGSEAVKRGNLPVLLEELPPLRKHQPALAHLDHGNSSPRGFDADRRRKERVLGLDGKRPETVSPFGAKAIDGFTILRLGKIGDNKRFACGNPQCSRPEGTPRRTRPAHGSIALLPWRENRAGGPRARRRARELPDSVSTACSRSLQ